jgi:MFS family permease
MSTQTIAQTETKAFSPNKGQRRYFFILLFLLYVFDYIDRNVVTVLFPQLKAEFGLTDTECGALVSVVTICVAIFTFPVSILIDRWSRKKSIGIMAVLWSIAAVSCAFTNSFKQLFVLRGAVGIGEAGYTPGGVAMITAYYPEEKRTTMMGLWNAGLPLGVAIGLTLGGYIATNFGWRYAFGITALPGLIVAVLFFWVKDYKTVKLVESSLNNQKEAEEKKKLSEIISGFVKTPSLIFTYLGYIGATFCSFGVLTWLPTYFHRYDGLSMDKAGPKAAIVFLLAIVGAPLGGIIADRMRKKRRNAGLLVPAYSQLVNGLLFAAAFFLLKGNLQYIAFILTGITMPIFIAGAATTTQDVVHPGLRAISYGLNSVIFFVLSGTLAPIFVGALSDKYDLLTAFKFLPIFSILSFIAFLIGSKFYEKDLEKVKNVSLEESNGN